MQQSIILPNHMTIGQDLFKLQRIENFEWQRFAPYITHFFSNAERTFLRQSIILTNYMNMLSDKGLRSTERIIFNKKLYIMTIHIHSVKFDQNRSITF